MLKLEHCRLRSKFYHKSKIECFGNLLHVHVCYSHVVLVYSTCKNPLSALTLRWIMRRACSARLQDHRKQWPVGQAKSIDKAKQIR